MSKAVLTLLLFGAGLALISAEVLAQDQATFHVQPDSRLWVEGTSNQDDWTVHATELGGSARMNQNVTTDEPGLEQLEVTVPSAKVLSQKSTIMDRLMHDALKVSEHPEIVYRLTSAQAAAAPQAGPNAFALQTRGQLTLAGVTKDIDMDVQGEALADGQVRFTGSHEMLMSDFGITPPSAMFGSLRTGDRVVVHFDLVVTPQAAN